MDINELQNAAIEAATEHIKNRRAENNRTHAKLYCLTVLACVLVICATVVSCFAICAQQETIREQQYALNMQYASLMDYIASAEITTTTTNEAYSDGDGSIAVAGNNNTMSGGK